ncbi:MAG: hypothetical protein JXO22_10210 [Phycisphaerae bacterium]|nr:hypothetical protein [Phycisphaerae bacterium]
MAMATASGSESRVDTQLVAGVAGKRVQVLRVLFSTVVTGTVALNTIVDGSADTAILGWMRAVNTRPIDMVLGREYAVTSELGAGLSYTADLGEYAAEHHITVWYELVP